MLLCLLVHVQSHVYFGKSSICGVKIWYQVLLRIVSIVIVLRSFFASNLSFILL